MIYCAILNVRWLVVANKLLKLLKGHKVFSFDVLTVLAIFDIKNVSVKKLKISNNILVRLFLKIYLNFI